MDIKVKPGVHDWEITFRGNNPEALKKITNYSKGAVLKKVDSNINVVDQRWITSIKKVVHDYNADEETCSGNSFEECKYGIDNG
jgi:nitrous oxidase accessory protein NosD